MGLDVTAYNYLYYVGHHDRWTDEDAHYEQHCEAYAYDDFPHALLGVPNVIQLKADWSTNSLSGGCFKKTEKTESYDFCAGTYTGYNAWRQDLADRFNPYRDNGRPSPEGPFYELIWFADNEGTIAQLAATSLLADFRQYEVQYRTEHATSELGEYFTRKYVDWMRACELAADDGLIRFH